MLPETSFTVNHGLFSSFAAPVTALLSALIAIGIFFGIFPRGQVSLTHSQNNRLLLTKKSGNKEKEKVSLVDVCKTATPSTCNLNPFLFNGHLQTMWTVVDSSDVPIYYKRKIFKSDIPTLEGQFAVDFVVDPYETSAGDDGQVTDKARKFTLPQGLPARTTFFTDDEFSALPSSDTKPMLILLHGLSGGSYERYLRCVFEGLQLKEEWEACVVNSRGCAQTKISTGLLFNARATWDLRQMVKWLRKTFPNRPLFGIGFSLGANILANVCTLYPYENSMTLFLPHLLFL